MQTLTRVLENIWPVFVNIVRLPFWIGHFAFRFVARIALLVTLAGIIIIIPILIAGVVILLLLPHILECVGIDPESIRVPAFLVTLGVFATLSNFFGKVILHSLHTLARNLLKTLGNEWLHWIPAWTIRASLLTTGQQLTEIGPKIWETLKTSGMLTLSILLVTIVLTLTYVHTKEPTKWQKGIDDRLATLEEQQTTLKDDFTAWQEKVTAMHPPRPPQLEEPLVVYSLAYPGQGYRSTNAGICPDPRTSEWLQEFKKAIGEYSRNEPRLQVEVEVRGFSSVAPVAGADCRNRSDQCNCDIANKRAEAVVGFLTSDDYLCEAVLNEQRWKSPGDDPCLRPKREFKLSTQDGFDVIYRPWQSYEEMTRHKPINDGLSDGQRRPAVEFLSRAVQIIVKTNPR